MSGLPPVFLQVSGFLFSPSSATTGSSSLEAATPCAAGHLPGSACKAIPLLESKPSNLAAWVSEQAGLQRGGSLLFHDSK